MVVSGSEFFREVSLDYLAVLCAYQCEVGPAIMIA